MITPLSGQAPEAQPGPEEQAVGTVGILSDLRATGGSAPEAADLGDAPPRLKLKVNSGVLVVLLVLTVSGGSLYFMRKQSARAGIHFDPKTVPVEFTTGRSPMQAAAEQRILADLARSGQQHMIPAERIQKNPFRLDSNLPATIAAPVAPVVQDNTPMIIQRLSGLQLRSVMQGPIPLARINDKTVRVGDIIEEWFVVAQIHDRAVDLVAENKTYTLSLPDGTNPAANGGRRPAPMGGGSPRR